MTTASASEVFTLQGSTVGAATAVLCVGGPLNRQGFHRPDFEIRCDAARVMYAKERELQPRVTRAALYYHPTGKRAVLPGGAAADVLSFQPGHGPRRPS